ncbi:hypothetical protein BJ165DRAFT_1509093 [Panaeolus papilionaceus]|nr:hypothetical protein BJ165DRAFT_1509093 [Panaeolus papilionaceus]
MNPSYPDLHTNSCPSPSPYPSSSSSFYQTRPFHCCPTHPPPLPLPPLCCLLSLSLFLFSSLLFSLLTQSFPFGTSNLAHKLPGQPSSHSTTTQSASFWAPFGAWGAVLAFTFTLGSAFRFLLLPNQSSSSLSSCFCNANLAFT